MDLRMVDLSGTSNQESDTNCVMADAISRRFTLDRGPLFRVSICKLDNEHHVFMLVFHHIVCDITSIRVFVKELAACYDALSNGHRHELTKVASSYSEYVAWQLRAHSRTSAASLTKARARLAGAPKPSWCSGANYRSLRTSTRSGNVTFTVEQDDARALRAMSRGADVTLAVTMLAIFEAVLYRTTATSDVVVGMPVVDRPKREFEELIGLFMNVLVVRTDVSGELSPIGLCRRISQAVCDAFDERPTRCGYHIQHLEPPFRIVFNFIKNVECPLALRGLVTERVSTIGEHPALADISLHVNDTDGPLLCKLLYKADLFTRTVVELMADDCALIIQRFIAAPDVALSGAPLLQ